MPSRRRLGKLDKLAGAPLFWAARAARIALHMQSDREAALPAEFMAQDRPAVLVIMDDDGSATGPEGWHCWSEARKWAATGYPFANAMDRKVYDAIVEEAIEHRRFVLVETTGPFVNAWRRALDGQPDLLEAVDEGAVAKSPL